MSEHSVALGKIDDLLVVRPQNELWLCLKSKILTLIENANYLIINNDFNFLLTVISQMNKSNFDSIERNTTQFHSLLEI